MIENLSQRVIEEGREHPLVRALVRGLERRLGEVTEKLEVYAEQAGNSGHIYALGGRVAELKNILRIIEDTEGTES